jgi:ribonucleoside-diphosphate reductase beta chain
MLMNFPRHNKMKGMGQIVSWSVRDESLHCESIINLFHNWAEETGCVTKAVSEDIRAVGETMVSLEDHFVDLAFEVGGVEGIAPDDVKNYVRYICDWRLIQLKMQPIYGYFEWETGRHVQLKPHPLPWLTAILNGVEHANFFETRATEYSKATTKGHWEGTDGAWNMFDKFQTNAALPTVN